MVAGRVFLVLALLLAQHSAIAHFIWHAAAGHAQDVKTSAAPEAEAVFGVEEELCAFHASLGTVLGAVGTASAQCHVADLPQHRPPLFAASALGAQAALPYSTGPPVSLPL